MARSLASKTNVNAPNSQYSYGRIRDDDGSGNGTPVDEQVYGDFHQFFARLLDKGGVTPNGLPDGDYYGFQYFQALFNGLMGGLKTTVLEIGTWNMDTTPAKKVLHLLPDHTKIRKVLGVTIRDDNGNIFDFGGSSDALGLSVEPQGAVLTRNNVAGEAGINSTGIWLARLDSGTFDSIEFDEVGAGYNRGWLTILHEI